MSEASLYATHAGQHERGSLPREARKTRFCETRPFVKVTRDLSLSVVLVTRVSSRSFFSLLVLLSSLVMGKPIVKFLYNPIVKFLKQSHGQFSPLSPLLLYYSQASS